VLCAGTARSGSTTSARRHVLGMVRKQKRVGVAGWEMEMDMKVAI
jgi:hypothetical protein